MSGTFYHCHDCGVLTLHSHGGRCQAAWDASGERSEPAGCVEAPPHAESGSDATTGSWLDRTADIETARKAALWDALVTLARSDRVAESYVALVRAREVLR